MKQKEQQLSNELVKQELQTLIDNIDERNENLLSAARKGKSIEQQNNIRLRSTPYLSLQRRGLITVDYLIAGFDRIQERTTRHSSAELYKQWYVSDSQEQCVDYIKQRF